MFLIEGSWAIEVAEEYPAKVMGFDLVSVRLKSVPQNSEFFVTDLTKDLPGYLHDISVDLMHSRSIRDGPAIRESPGSPLELSEARIFRGF